MGCKECGKPKCNGECGCKSPKVLQINNPAEYITFHKVSIPAAMGDSTTNPPKIGAYRNALVYYEADHTSWMYSTDGIPTLVTGEQGETGPQGPAGTIAIGTTTTGATGEDASVENVGTPENAILNFTIPRGEQGDQGPQGETGPQGYMNEQDVRNVVNTIVPEGFFDDESTVLDCGTEFELENLVGGAPVSLRLEGDTFQQNYTGKNLFDVTATPWYSGRAYNSDGDLAYWTGYTAIIAYQPVEPNSTYTFSNSTGKPIYYGLVFYDADKNKISNVSSATRTFTTPADCHYVRFAIQDSSIPTWAQLEEGSIATDFEQFVGGTPSPNPEFPQPIQTVTGTQTISVNGTDYPLDLGAIELCKLDTYQDYIWKDGDDWKLHKAISKRIFDGTQGVWGTYDAQSGVKGFYGSYLPGAMAGSSSNQPVVSDHFKGAYGSGNNEVAMSATAGSVVFRISSSTASTPEDFDTWLASNNTTVYYALAAPTDTTITDQTLIAQLEAIELQSGTNTISVTSEGLAGSICLGGYISNWEGTVGSIEQSLSERVYSVDTAAEMSLREFNAGEQVRTLGYWEKNDGGGALYKIRKITNDDVVDNGSIIPLNDPQSELIAELISTSIYPEMFGAYGDGVHNDTTSFNNAINYTDTLELHGFKTYKLTSLNIAKNLTVNGNNSTLIDDTAVDKFIAVDTTSTPKVLTVKFNDLNVDCPNSNYGIYVHTNRCEINNVLVKNAINTCVSVYKGSTSGRYGNLRATGLACQLSEVGLDIHATDCFIEDFRGYNCMTHINVSSGLTHLETVHGWNFNTQTKDWITGSVLINLAADVVMNDIYSDTLESAFVLPTGSQYMTVEGTNISQFLNTSSYPNTQASPLLVKNIENYTGWIKLTNISANANNWRDTNNQQPILFPTTFSQIKANFDNVISIGYRHTDYIPVVVEGDVQTSEYTVTTEVNYLSPNLRKRWEYKNEKRMHWYFALSRDLPDNTCIFSAQMAETSRFSNINELTKKVSATAKFVSSSTQGLTYELDASLHNGLLTIYNHTGLTLDNGAVVFNYNLEEV